jgi:hypothetical protein
VRSGRTAESPDAGAATSRIDPAKRAAMVTGDVGRRYSTVCAKETTMAKGIEKGKKNNKPKVSIKERQKKKKEKTASK